MDNLEKSIERRSETHYTIAQLCEILGMSRDTVTRHIADGSYQMGQFKECGRWRVPKEGLDRWRQSPGYLKIRGISRKDLIEEYEHFTRFMRPEVAAERLEAMYGYKKFSIRDIITKENLKTEGVAA